MNFLLFKLFDITTSLVLHQWYDSKPDKVSRYSPGHNTDGTFL